MIDLGLEYTTRDGREVFGLVHCPENPEAERVMGFIRDDSGYTESCSWLEDGYYDAGESDLDLIPKQERWRAEDGESYLFVSSNGVIGWAYRDDAFINEEIQYKTGNYFQTEEQAKASKFYKVFHD